MALQSSVADWIIAHFISIDVNQFVLGHTAWMDYIAIIIAFFQFSYFKFKARSLHESSHFIFL